MPPKKKYEQTYRKEWEKDPILQKWVTSLENNPSSAFCKYCKCELKAHYRSLKDHGESAKHVKNSEILAPQKQPRIPFKPVNLKVQETEGSLAIFVAAHCAIQASGHLATIARSVCGKSPGYEKMIQLGRTKCTAVIKNVIGPYFGEMLSKDIGELPYSITIDESTDISVSKKLGVCVQYISLSASKSVSTFLDICKLESADAEGIYEAVKATLKNHGLPLSNLVGVGTDNASVMTGINTGVFTRLKQDVPNLILVRCVCHSVQLAVSAAVQNTMPRNLEFLTSETYSWFSRSPERQERFKTLFNELNDGSEPLKIVKVSGTRWLSIFQAIDRILKYWKELKIHFDKYRTEEKCYAAELLFQMFSDDRNRLYLMFLHPILEETWKVNKQFQTNENAPEKLLKSLTMLIQGLAQRIVSIGCKENFLTIQVRDHLHPKPHLGYAFESEITKMRVEHKLSVEDDKNIRARCIDFIVTVVSQLQQRLPDNANMLENVSLLAPEMCLRRVQQPIVKLMKIMKEPTETATRIDYQWSKLSFVEWEHRDDTVAFWCEVERYKDAAGEAPFKDLARFALKCLSLPWSNAEIERTFSQMNVVKTPHRNRMNDSTLVAILQVRAGLRREGKCCDSYELPPSVLRKIGTVQTYKETKETENDEDSGGEFLEVF